MRVRKLAKEIEAHRFIAAEVRGETTQVLPPEWFLTAFNDGTIEYGTKRDGSGFLTIHDKVNNHGDLIANDGDWIMRGVNGELYPCTNDVFEQTYERIE
jgi:hypothetical protein